MDPKAPLIEKSSWSTLVRPAELGYSINYRQGKARNEGWHDFKHLYWWILLFLLHTQTQNNIKNPFFPVTVLFLIRVLRFRNYNFFDLTTPTQIFCLNTKMIGIMGPKWCKNCLNKFQIIVIIINAIVLGKIRITKGWDLEYTLVRPAELGYSTSYRQGVKSAMTLTHLIWWILLFFQYIQTINNFRTLSLLSQSQ